ncbi:hypothetical protein K469DRAFT_742163 [Zopfia rhizophila CBS 207.26]|uniref:Uncharacterized protein n=1 Tax=Zopfia rhizophila CBS 207.26 TaxID=1314779 RepID=A0A6A6DJB3_9PEZI|nr:hypothetical protein K469DRAFT_742163 [Zopfia rhizophila CBS 207.26]
MALADCVSYGMDFQNGGSYFQNSMSNDPFTFVTQYSAYNILVDPKGDQTLCSDTQLTPDDTDRLSTCPLLKSQFFSGPWSIIVISDNGDGDEIAYERDFELSVGPQTTVTVNITATKTDTTTSIAPPRTATKPSITVTPTITVTPARVTKTSTKALLTLKLTSYSLSITKTSKTKTATCKTPTRLPRHDPTATIRPTVGPTVGPAALLASAKFCRNLDAEEKAQFLKERKARLDGRAPDPQPLTVTDTNTAHWVTVTSTSTTTPSIATITVATTITQTLTPPPITLYHYQNYYSLRSRNRLQVARRDHFLNILSRHIGRKQDD